MTRGRPFRKGQSGNPAGRPPKERTLTRLVERALSRTMEGKDGRRISRKRRMAEILAQAVSEGTITIPTEQGEITVPLAPDQYITLTMRLLNHIDGPAPAEANVHHDGEVVLKWDWQQKSE
jgi:hypothetical protein